MHSLHAFALMHEKRMASAGSRFTRIQRRPSSTVWPGSNGTSNSSKRPGLPGLPRQTRNLAVFILNDLMRLPIRRSLRIVFALVRAAAFRTIQCCARHALGDKPHVAQVHPVDPFGIHSLAGSGRASADLAQRLDMRERALEPGARA